MASRWNIGIVGWKHYDIAIHQNVQGLTDLELYRQNSLERSQTINRKNTHVCLQTWGVLDQTKTR